MTIVALGYFTGLRPDEQGQPRYLIRLGRELVSIHPLDHLVWRTACGTVDQIFTDEWGREMILRLVLEALSQGGSAAQTVDRGMVEAAYERLWDAGLLADVGELSGASELRARGLGQAIGQTADDPDREIVGVDDRAVSLLTREAFELWQVCDQHDTLRDAVTAICSTTDEAARRDAYIDLLVAMRLTQALGLAYFDRPPGDEPISYLS